MPVTFYLKVHISVAQEQGEHKGYVIATIRNLDHPLSMMKAVGRNYKEAMERLGETIERSKEVVWDWEANLKQKREEADAKRLQERRAKTKEFLKQAKLSRSLKK